MKYIIKPRLYLEEERYWIMSDEIFKMTLSEIQNGIDTCLSAIDGNQTGFSWGLEVFELMIEKETSILEYHGEFVAEIPTQDILKMLQDYKRALEYFENKYNNENL